MGEKIITATVRRGRTVQVEGGTQEVGIGDKRRRIPVEGKILKPGTRFTLPESEMKPLIDHGFVEVVKDGGELPKALTTGPKVLQEGANAPKVEIEA